MPHVILLVGEPKTGKTVSACTFPKPLALLDFDNGWKSVLNTKDKLGKLVVPDHNQIVFESFIKPGRHDLAFKTQEKGKYDHAPAHTANALDVVNKYNEVIGELHDNAKIGDVSGIKTVVIDSLTTVFRTWKEAIMKVNNIPALRIADYGTLEGALFGQFIPTIKSMESVDYIILIDHMAIDKDEVTGKIIEYPIGPSMNQGRGLSKEFDEVWLMDIEGDKRYWRTQSKGFFTQAGSRTHLPEKVEAHYKHVAKYLEE